LRWRAFLLNRARPRVETDRPSAVFVRASGKCAACHIQQQYAVVLVGAVPDRTPTPAEIIHSQCMPGRGPGRVLEVFETGRRSMKRVCHIIGTFALLTLVAGPIAAQEAIKEGAEKTKDAVVKGTKVAVEKTKEGLSKTGEVMTDSWITTRIHERFVGEDLLKDSDISVDTSKHVVTLKGTVIGKAGRARATAVARGTEGVRSVVNRLTIGPKH
jgi:BON domain